MLDSIGSQEECLNRLRMPEYPSQAEVRARHRRAVLQQIVGPVALTAAVMIAVLALMVLAFSPRQFGIIASCMSLLILVPTVLICLVPYVALVAMFAGIRKLYLWLPSRLRAARTVVHQSDIVAHRVSRAITNPIIAISQRLAWIERVAGRKQRFLPMERK
jgi:hypothetical protein